MATKDTSYFHILELLSYKRKEVRIFEVRFGMEKDEIANECWKKAWDAEFEAYNRNDSTFHREAYNNCQISNHLDDRKTRKTTSILVNNYLSEAYDLYANRVRLIREKSEDIILCLNLDRKSDMSESENSKEYNEDILVKLIERASLSVPEKYLYLWKMGIKTKEQVKKELGVNSDATLYNRWDKLSKKFCTVYYSNEDIFRELK